MKFSRKEYPRPQFRRDEWTALNGEWQCLFDDRSTPPAPNEFDRKINVPFTYEYAASGIGDAAPHDCIWYRRTFKTTDKFVGKRALLCFNGSDFVTDVFVNGKHVTRHVGGFSPFFADITEFAHDGENEITVRCYDPLDPTTPRGKQSWTGRPFGCWYTPNTGIWQSVWLELVGDDCIESYFAEPNIDECGFSGEVSTLYGRADALRIDVYVKGALYKTQTVTLDGKHTRYSVKLMEENFVDESMYWTPENPNLINIDLRLFKGDDVVDVVHTRLGMRKISVDEHGQICLNNKPLYQRLILDQGYWKDSGLTPPSAEAIKKDIELSKAMGFNGARKHQKFEDPYFYYYADELGFLTWCEMPSAYNFNSREMSLQIDEWQQIIATARNFASVICYVPLNESWGVRKILVDKHQQDYARALYFITKATDGSRLISTNDGWEVIDNTDIIGIHDYSYDSSKFLSKYTPENIDSLYPVGRKMMAHGCKYNGQPLLFTEFGGMAFKNNEDGENWGYNEGVADEKEFLSRLKNLMDGIYACPFQGYCYTQLTDVQQEVNGLLDPDRNPKIDVKKLNKIFAPRKQ